MGVVILGIVLSLQLAATVGLYWRERTGGVADCIGLICASLNIILIGALMWEGILT